MTNNERFQSLIQPTRDALRALVDVGRETRTGHGGLPAAASQGMAELEAEANYAGIWGSQPISTAHTTAGLLLYAAEDAASALAWMFDDAAPTFVFAHMEVARGVLEASARARWLVECKAGTRGRVARIIASRVADLVQRVKIEGKLDPTVGVATGAELDGLLERALDHGFARRTKKGGISLLEGAPGYLALVEELFQHTEFGGERVPTAAYAHYSGVLHAHPWALAQSIDKDSIESNALRAGIVTAPMVTSLENVVAAMGVVAAGYMEGVDELCTLMGWPIPAEWREARTNAIAAVAERLPSPDHWTE